MWMERVSGGVNICFGKSQTKQEEKHLSGYSASQKIDKLIPNMYYVAWCNILYGCTDRLQIRCRRLNGADGLWIDAERSTIMGHSVEFPERYHIRQIRQMRWPTRQWATESQTTKHSKKNSKCVLLLCVFVLDFNVAICYILSIIMQCVIFMILLTKQMWRICNCLYVYDVNV